MGRRDRDDDRDRRMTVDQDNFNNYSNYRTSKAIGDDTSARHWRDNWLGEIGGDDRHRGRDDEED